jgi:protein-tyrosine-phosphatase
MSLLLSKKKSKKVVLFLCTGDTCRGPMAQGYMKDALAQKNIKNVEVRTAGVMTIAGLIPTPEAVQVMKNAGIDVMGHRSTPLTIELIRKADLILGMSTFHVQFALRMSEEAKGKTFLLKEYAASDLKNYQITDPMGATWEVYKRVYREMKLAIDKMLEQNEFFAGDVRKPTPQAAAAPATAASKARKRTKTDTASKAKAPAKPTKPAAKAAKPAKAAAASKTRKAAKPSKTAKPAAASKGSKSTKKPSKQAAPATRKAKPASAAKKPAAKPKTAKKRTAAK